MVDILLSTCYDMEEKKRVNWYDVLERPKGQYIEYIGDTPQTLE